MSLLIFNSSNRIAQGVIRRLYGSGAYERIVCADVYPNYPAIQRFLNFQKELKETTSNTKLTDIQVTEKTDLVNAVNSASHILYITHDYYSLVPSKLNLIKTVAEAAKKNKNLKRLVALTPLEHDHFGETNPIESARASESNASQIYPGLTLLKSDLTFGPDSTLATEILRQLTNQTKLAVSPSSSVSARPIHTENIAEIVEATLQDSAREGQSYLLQGNESVTLENYINTLRNHVKTTSEFHSFAGKIINTQALNLISEQLYDPAYINLVRLLTQYKELPRDGLQGVDGFNVQFKNFASAYPSGGFTSEKSNDSSFERWLRNLTY